LLFYRTCWENNSTHPARNLAGCLQKSLPNHSSRSERFGLESASVCRIFFENIFKKYFQTPEKYIFKKYFGLGNLFSTFFEESFREKIF
jgi:hypothetical protein